MTQKSKAQIPKNGIILDVGGGYGWHWKDLPTLRPDVTVVILDMIEENLRHAMKILGNNMDNIYLVLGDATDLIFDDESFDGYWTVQTLQHVPNFNSAIEESYRVLKTEGMFANYSLNNQAIVKLIYTILGKKYYTFGFKLAAASEKQFNCIQNLYGDHSYKRYSEIIYEPGLKLIFPGRKGSLIGWIDSKLSGKQSILATIARQQSFHAKKKGKQDT